MNLWVLFITAFTVSFGWHIGWYTAMSSFTLKAVG